MPQAHKEKIFFHKGLGADARSPLMEPGYLRAADGFVIDRDGVTKTLPAYSSGGLSATISAAMTPVSGLYIDPVSTYLAVLQLYDPAAAASKLFYSPSDYSAATQVSAGTVAYGSLDLGAWCPNMVQKYGNMYHIFGTNGGHLMIEAATGNMFNGAIKNPASAVTTADSGDAGNPDGVYICYASFLITFPDGMTYETGLSPSSAEVTVVTNKISWTDIPLAVSNQYLNLTGAVSIKRKLYRGPGAAGTLADIYYVATIDDNTTTTYTDDSSDVTLIANGVCDVTGYQPIGVWSTGYTRTVANAFGCFHYGRFYTTPLGTTYGHRLYYSEAAGGDTSTENEIILPIASKTDNWIDLRVCAPHGGVSVKGLVSWGTYLYIATKQTWLKKSGEDPDTWAMKKTFALHGVAASATICFSEEAGGMVYLTQDHSGRLGVASFNGDSSQLLASPKLDKILNENETSANDIDLTYTSAVKIGPYYILQLAYNVGGTIKAGYLNYILDFSRFPDVRVTKSLKRRSLTAWGDSAGTCHCYFPWSDQRYFTLHEAVSVSGTVTLRGFPSTLYPLTCDTSTYISTAAKLWTHDLCGGAENITRKKRLKKLKYSLYHAGDDATTYPPQVTLYVDGIATSITMDAFGDAEANGLDGGGSSYKESYRELSLPHGIECYTYSLSIAPQSSEMCTGLEIYSPWEMDLEILD
jgi:hypothetical protein